MTTKTQAPASIKSVTREHKMPFGTDIHSGAGRVDFRLWAPGAERIDLELESNGKQSNISMRKNDRGWFTTEAQAKAGDLYKFVVDNNLKVPDPASRFQPKDVHGPSQILDPSAFSWTDEEWKGRPWEESVLYELNVGTFTPEGTFKAIEGKLRELADLGVTAIELMPVSDFPGRWGWGYDGVLPFAPDSSYGRPEDLKSLVQAAHREGLMIFLDVVYNHFGPEGNYLHAYAKKFFTEKHHTPWGSAINVDDTDSDIVRRFFIENALYWLNEFHFDGLRFDAVHAIKDESEKHFLVELAEAVAAGPGAERHVHLVLENDDNIAQLLRKTGDTKVPYYSAQWNDDIHHAFHVLSTGEDSGYYAAFTSDGCGISPVEHLARCLTEGFTYQGQACRHHKHPKGQPSAHLPPTAFVSFIQNHDQTGNRAFGDRIASLTSNAALHALSAIYLLAPSVPMIFMGEEWGSKVPFNYFCDVGPELGPLVTEGRRKEFAKFPQFSSPQTRERIPDPCAEETFLNSKLNWREKREAVCQDIFKHYRLLLSIRRKEIVPLLRDWQGSAKYALGDRNNVVHACWKKSDGKELHLLANLSDHPTSIAGGIGKTSLKDLVRILSSGRAIYASDALTTKEFSKKKTIEPWSVLWLRA